MNAKGSDVKVHSLDTCAVTVGKLLLQQVQRASLTFAATVDTIESYLLRQTVSIAVLACSLLQLATTQKLRALATLAQTSTLPQSQCVR